MLYRRELVAPHLEKLARCGIPAEHMLSMAIAEPWYEKPKEARPVHLPIVGRLWRWHGRNYHRRCGAEDVDFMATLLGFPNALDLAYRGGTPIRDHQSPLSEGPPTITVRDRPATLTQP